MMTGNEFRNSLRSGKTVCGTLVTSTSPRMFDTIVNLKCDFVFLCNEHVFYNPESLGWMCRAYRAAGIVPVVRILKPDPALATQALDSGACAVLAPYVEDPAQITELIGAVRYRPLKGKKLRDLLSGSVTPEQELVEYLKNYNRDNSLLINIESPAGIASMEDMMSLNTIDGPGVDGFIIGPHDLSVSYDMPVKYSGRDFIALGNGIIRKARKSGFAAGGHNGSRESLELQKEWVKAGANIIMYSSDILLFADKYSRDINFLRSIKGESGLENTQEENI